eukprot:23077-Hanusia_phi.AAC.2
MDQAPMKPRRSAMRRRSRELGASLSSKLLSADAPAARAKGHLQQQPSGQQQPVVSRQLLHQELS